MKILEEGYLKKSVEKFNIFIKEQEDFNSFFLNSINLDIKSLQRESFKGDVVFFDEVSFIISVVASIIARPHLLTKEDEIVVRSALAPKMDTESFLKTVRDTKLWKQHGAEKIPEYVYYKEYNDLIRIYENIFIVMLVDMLSHELDLYHIFYSSLVKTYDKNHSLSISTDYSLRALEKITKLQRKMKFIKATRFYKEIKKGGVSLKEVHASNILINDRLYNYCYKFYKRIVAYKDDYERVRDIRTYYFALMIKELKANDYKVMSFKQFNLDQDSVLNIEDIVLEKDDFSITLNFEDHNKLIYSVSNKVANKKVADEKHLLIFNGNYDFESYDYDESNGYRTTEVMNLWRLFFLDNGRVANEQFMLESELANKYLFDKTRVLLADRKYYKKYCPSCKHDYYDATKSTFIRCPNCGSEYTFYNKDGKNYLWFIKLRQID